MRSRIQAKDRPGALPVPADAKVSAFTGPAVFEKWNVEAAGVVSALERGDNVITMFDVIGEDYWTGGGVTAKKVASQLRAIGDRDIEVHINSAGGDMFEGIAIYNVLREHPKAITVKVMGMAASAASIIAMAGDRVEIGAASFLMIHNCWIIAMGNRLDMRAYADMLEPFDAAMRDVYAARSGLPANDCAAMLDKETWMSGSTAVEKGFADALLAADQVKVDEDAKASDRKVNELRAMELTLVAAGTPRSEARARLNKIKGGSPGSTPGAASEDGTVSSGGTPGAAASGGGAADTDLTGALAGLLTAFSS